jgi:hypothetical protein
LMSFKKGDTTHALRDGGLVALDDSGNVVPANNDTTASANSGRAIGVARLNVTLTDTSSWTGAPMVPVEVPVEQAVEWLIDLDSDVGALDSDIGRLCSVDTVGGGSVNAGDSAGMRLNINDTAGRIVLTTGRISGARVIGSIVKTIWHRSASDTVAGL